MGMSATERLKFILTADVDGAIRGFEKVGTTAERELKKAESASSKLSGNMTKFGAGAIVVAGVAGAALVKTAGSFSELGIAIGHMHDATGLSYKSSSQLHEVMKDLGLDSGTLEGALGKLNKATEKTPKAFAAIGAEIVRTNTGAVDTQATFMSVIDAFNRTGGAAAHSAEATAIFGKGWQSMAEVIAGGSDKLKASMGAVDTSKIFDAAKVQQAKDYRDSMDVLKDSVDKLVISIGQGAAPVIGGLAKVMGGAISAFGDLNAISGGTAGTLLTVATAAVGIGGALSVVAGQALKMKDRFTNAEGGLNSFGKAAKGLGVAIGAAGLAWTLYELQQSHAADEARKMVDVMDKLTGATDDVAKSVSERLIIAMTAFGKATPQEAVDKLTESNVTAAVKVRDLAAADADYAAKLASHGVTVAMLTTAIDNHAASQKRAKEATDRASTATDALAQSTSNVIGPTAAESAALQAVADTADLARHRTDNLTAAWAAWKQGLADQQSIIDLENGFADLKTKQDAAWKAAQDGSSDAAQKMRDLQAEQITVTGLVGDYAQKLGGVPPEVVTLIQAAIDNGSIDSAVAAMHAIELAAQAAHNAVLSAVTADGERHGANSTVVSSAPSGVDPYSPAAVAYYNALAAQNATKPHHATGTSYAEDAFIAGEDGPELITGHKGATVTPANQTAKLLGGHGAASSTVVNIYPRVLPTDAELINLIGSIRRRNGGIL